MNERFQQLLKQSTNPPWDGEQGPMNEFNLERFAELIVRQCIEINKQELSFNAFERLMNKYKEHFGVEE